ncbi:hypothetical protein SAMN05878503_102394 [Cereibacter ovatus]|uniref:Gamma-glutamyl kinase n=1 Tax=Cereibacter ovatus TaxID=439529 RepID=A0A285CN30_9RHOB|nr:hypothetical protein [Cereibacter ovatus]SNX68954.1 hypothetical protein SAMN05878503_102394 [Cereibacter ovatus]
MLVFWEQRLAFLATPKTGTTAIEAALESLATVSIQRPPNLKHTTAQRYRRFIGPYLEAAAGEEFTLVALMREPRAWLGSWFRYRQREDILDQARSTADLGFDDFVRAYASDPQPDFAAVGSQARFLDAKSGKGVDRIFRYEDIGGFIDFLEERLGCEIILPRLNVSPSASLDLSDESEALLRQVLEKDFALYESLG